MIYDLITPVAVYLGVIGGYFLAMIAPEELKPGYKYLVIFQNIVSSIFVSVVALFLMNGIVKPIPADIIAMLAAIGTYYYLCQKNLSRWIFMVGGIFIFFSRNDVNFHLLISVILFMIAAINVSAYAEKYVKKDEIKKKKELLLDVLKRYSLFFVFSILPYIVSALI